MSMHADQKWPDKAHAEPLGMLVSVVKLRRHGVSISKQEFDEAVAAPVIGRLLYEDPPPAGSGGMRRHRQAVQLRLPSPDGTGQAATPLFNPFTEK